MNRTVLFLTAISFSILCNGQIIKKQIPDKLVVFTFDDATASQYSVVAPLLKEYGFGATFYICEFPPNFSDTSKYMNWKQISELHKMGFEIANHTKNHPNATKIPKEEFIKELEYIERKCDSFGIPKPNSISGLWLKSFSFEYNQRKKL